MLLKSNDVIENIDEVNLSRELEIAKFRNYGREHFSDLLFDKISLEAYIKNSSQFFSISLPKEISDYFIRFDSAPNYLMTDSPTLKFIEEHLTVKKNDYNFI